MATRIQVRRDTAANWAAASTTVLASGEIGFETDTRQFKIGDGTAQWQNLEYAGGTTPIIQNASGTAITDLNAAALRNNGNAKYLILGADSASNEPSGLTTATDGQLLVTVAKYDYLGTSAANERFLMTLTTLTTNKTYYRTYNGSWSAWYLIITADASGNATVPGDLAVNGGDITTNQTTATVFNTNATTLNVGEAATTVSIGATTGTATIRNATTAIQGSATVGTTLGVTGNTTLTGDLAVNGGDITTSAATATVFDSTATSVDIAGAATTLNIADGATAAQTINIGTGVTVSGATKTINIGTGGATGSTTNINLGDADGGTVVVNRALTVNGLTTLSGGLSGTIDYSNLPSGSIINFETRTPASQEVEADPFSSASQVLTIARAFSYTPKMSGSIIKFCNLYMTITGYRNSSSNGFTGNITGSISVAASAGGGTISLIEEDGASLSMSVPGNVYPSSKTVGGSLLLTHTGGTGVARTYTLTGTVTGPSGSVLSTASGRVNLYGGFGSVVLIFEIKA